MVAFAFLAVLATRRPQPTPTIAPNPDRPLALSVIEIRRLLQHAFVMADTCLRTAIRWLTWRLVHQARARHCHHKRRAALDISR